MIIETLIIGVTIIFVSSLIFANIYIKRRRQWELEDNAPEPVLSPFINIILKTPCPKCGRPAKNKDYYSSAEGPGVPFICIDSKCPANKVTHLHVACYTCKAEWFMEPADSKSPKKKIGNKENDS